MGNATVSRDELLRMAEEIGLARVAEMDPASLEKALAAARRLKSEMQRDFALADEPAHVFRAGEEA
jgi:hypothetical protein